VTARLVTLADVEAARVAVVGAACQSSGLAVRSTRRRDSML
jgi:hypothetical protein